MKYEVDIRKELFQAAEEEFFEREFGVGSAYENYKRGVDFYYNSYISASATIERLQNGECLDNVGLNFAVQQLIITYKSASKLRKNCDGKKLVDIGALDMPKDAVECSMRGNQFLGNFGISKDLSDYERGKWYSLSALDM
jgi:hypothetical protein